MNFEAPAKRTRSARTAEMQEAPVQATAQQTAAPNAAEIEEALELKKKYDNKKMADKDNFYRCSVRFPKEFESYLTERVYQERTKGGIGGYIIELVRADREKHPDWQKTINELND